MSWWIMNLIQIGMLKRMDTNVMMDYEFDTGWNVEKDVYKCYDGLWIWHRLGLIVYLIRIIMLRIDTNIMIDYEFDIGWNVGKDGYECYDGLWIWYRLGLIDYLIWIDCLSDLNTNVKDG